MIRVSERIGRSLTLVQKQNFSNMLFNSSANPIKERVMSTPTWPVPYYQRMVKAYPVRGKSNPLTQNKKKLTSLSWTSTPMTPTGTPPNKSLTILSKADKSSNTPKKTSKPTVKHSLTSAYLIRKNDCETMVRSYVDDCGQFLDIANR
jgi:hypothetical protein